MMAEGGCKYRRESNDDGEHLSKRRDTPIRKTFHGVDYQIRLLMLCALKGWKLDGFQLRTEAEDAGKFDDLVVRYQKDDKEHFLMLQAKHKVQETETISLRDLLLAGDKQPFSLVAYFNSYRNYILKSDRYKDKTLELIIITNIGFDSAFKDKCVQEVRDEKHILHLVDNKLKGRPSLWKFKEDFPRRNEIVNKLYGTDDSVNDFLSKLVFAVNYSKKKLKVASEKEIHGPFRSGFYTEMVKYLDARKNKVSLSSKEVEDIISKFKQHLARSRLNGLTFLYKEKIKDHRITFKYNHPNLKEITEFLQEETNDKQMLIINQESPSLSLIKLCQVLEKKEKEDAYIFFGIKSMSSLLYTETDPVSVFKSKGTHYLIIEIDTELKGEAEQHFLERSLDVIKKDKTKKVILIVPKEERIGDIHKIIKKCNIDIEKNSKEIQDDKNSLKDLTERSVKKLLEERKIIFQGKKITLGELIIDGKRKKMIKGDLISRLINGKEIHIGKGLQGIGKVGNYHVSRKLYRQITIKGTIKKENKSFYVTSDREILKIDPKLNQDIYKDAKDIVLIAKNDKCFQMLCEKYKEYNIHWLKNNKVLAWQRTRGSISKLRAFVDEKREFPLYNYKKIQDYASITEKAVIVSAPPGMGKSTLLTSLEEKIKKPNSWVARINLIDCATDLERRNDGNIEFNLVEVFKFLYASLFKGEKEEEWKKIDEYLSKFITVKDNEVCLENCDKKIKSLDLFEIQLFNDFFNRGKVSLLFDAFDEISPDYKEKVIELLRVLKETKAERVWVTTRPYGILPKLEDELGVFSYGLNPFSKNDQEEFLMLYWNAKQEKCKKIIKNLLDMFSQKLGRDFCKIPLHIRMIAEVFQNRFKEFYDSEKEKLSKDDKGKLLEEMNLLNLYADFFERKFDQMYPMPDAEKCKPVNKKRIITERKKCITNHMKLGFCAVFGIDLLEELKPGEKENVLNGENSLMKTVKEGEERTGIISRIVNNLPVFIHQTFAEYFASQWLHENLNNEKVLKFLQEKFFGTKLEVIRKFLDYRLCRDDKNKRNYELHVAVLNKNVIRIKSLLENDNIDIIHSRDTKGRTALHLAAAYNYVEIAKYLLKKLRKDEIKKDELFGFTPMMTAAMNGNWKLVELLLQHGANGDDMLESIKTIQNSKIETAEEGVENVEALLFLSTRKGYLAILKYLLDNEKVDYKIRDKDGYSPLHEAIKWNKPNVLKYLMKIKNIDVNLKTSKGETPLHIAARKGFLDIIKYLVEEKGADCNIQDNEGYTPLQSAHNEMKQNVVQYLTKIKNNDVNLKSSEVGPFC